MNKIPAHNSHGTVGKADSNLAEVLKRNERRYLRQSVLRESFYMPRDCTGNRLFPFWMPTVHRHFGPPVFFSVLSRAQTFSTGSLERSSAIVMRSDVFGTCLRCVIAAAVESAALKERMTLNARERMRTTPLESPRKRVSPPVAREVRSFYSKRLDNEVPQDKAVEILTSKG